MIYRAKVIFNQDPQLLGRIKVEVPPFLVTKETALKLQMGVEGIDTASMPWAVPAFPLFDGSSNGSGWFTIPKVGSFVFIFFENNDIYQPVYFAEAPDATRGVPVESGAGYPYTKVIKTSNGMVISIKDTPNEVLFTIAHPSGSYIKMFSNGNVEIHSQEDLILSAGGKAYVSGDEVHLN